ncbi:hypothetical protein OIV83_003629 [Microbotryomycetes sp. JL201]|nr:hypothetical protein OIV83_003629 [Microbotryomycetes sp. JL201]
MQNAPTPSNAYSAFLNVGSPAFSPPAGASPSPALTKPSPAPSAGPRPTSSAPLLPPQLAQQSQTSFSTPVPPAAPGSAGGYRSGRAASVASRTGGPSAVVDINLECRKAYTLLMGPASAESTAAATAKASQSAGGLLDKLELEFDAVMHKLEHAYDDNDGLDGDITIETLLATISSVVNALQSSALGGFPLPSPQTEAHSLQQRIDVASTTVQKLFRERQRAKEGADVVANVLNSA